jgi:hypothetical protein
VENDLVGTWKFIPSIGEKLFARPSIIILKKNGCYEIHNPPIWLRKICKPPAKIFMSESCGEIIIGNWTWGRRKPSVGLNGIDNFGGHILGKRQPYQLQYCRIAPDITPLRCWQWMSQETQCPHCQRKNNLMCEIKEPIYEFDTYDHQKLEIEELENLRCFVIVIGIFLMVIGLLYKVFRKNLKLLVR